MEQVPPVANGNEVPNKPTPAAQTGKWQAIVVTAVVTAVVTFIAMVILFTVMSRRHPPTPQLRPPLAIKVRLYPNSNWGVAGTPPVYIPVEQHDRVLQLVTPDQYYEGGMHDWICPIIAEIVFIHEGMSETRLMIRDCGHNPALISVDGQNYFWGHPHDDVCAGANELVRLVSDLSSKK